MGLQSQLGIDMGWNAWYALECSKLKFLKESFSQGCSESSPRFAFRTEWSLSRAEPAEMWQTDLRCVTRKLTFPQATTLCNTPALLPHSSAYDMSEESMSCSGKTLHHGECTDDNEMNIGQGWKRYNYNFFSRGLSTKYSIFYFIFTPFPVWLLSFEVNLSKNCLNLSKLQNATQYSWGSAAFYSLSHVKVPPSTPLSNLYLRFIPCNWFLNELKATVKD